MIRANVYRLNIKILAVVDVRSSCFLFCGDLTCENISSAPFQSPDSDKWCSWQDEVTVPSETVETAPDSKEEPLGVTDLLLMGLTLVTLLEA